MNKAILIGRLAADPELRKTESGISKCLFTVAVQEDYKNKDGSRDVDFLQVVAWRQTAEFVSRYFKKGSGIAVLGRNKCDEYNTKDGTKSYFKYIKAESVEFVGYNKDKSDDTNEGDTSDFAAEYEEIMTDEVPFA